MIHSLIAGAVVAQKVAGLSPFAVMSNIFSLNSRNSLKTFKEN